MRYYFKIADIKIMMDSEIDILWNDYIERFRVDAFDDPDEAYECRCSDRLEVRGQLIFQDSFQRIYIDGSAEERLHFFWGQEEPCMLYRECGDTKVILLNNKYKASFLEQDNYVIFNAMAIEKVLLRYQALILHSSYILKDDWAILFTAPSGTGKSTQAALWEEYKGAVIVNGDRTILREKDGKFYASGMPVCGSSDICLNVDAPIRAIVYLSQAASDWVEELDYKEKTKNLISEITIPFYDKERMVQTLDLIERFSLELPMYHLFCTKEKSAVDTLDKKLREDSDGSY